MRISLRIRGLGFAATVSMVLLAGCGETPRDRGPAGGQDPSTTVAVAVDDGSGDTQSFTVTCGQRPAFTEGDPGGRDAAAACAALEARHDRLVRLSDAARDPEMCTDIYGGPDTATLQGHVLGDAIDVRIHRGDGCGVADWETLTALLGAPRGTLE